jgi:predicted Na+-dependent transporter
VFKRIEFILWILVALFILVPILNVIIQDWVKDGGILDETFNSTNAVAWNSTGKLLTANQTAAIGLTPLETAVTQFYVPAFVIFFAVIILYVLSKGTGGGGGAYN